MSSFIFIYFYFFGFAVFGCFLHQVLLRRVDFLEFFRGKFGPAYRDRAKDVLLGCERSDDLFKARIAAERGPKRMQFQPTVVGVAGHRQEFLD